MCSDDMFCALVCRPMRLWLLNPGLILKQVNIWWGVVDNVEAVMTCMLHACGCVCLCIRKCVACTMAYVLGLFVDTLSIQFSCRLVFCGTPCQFWTFETVCHLFVCLFVCLAGQRRGIEAITERPHQFCHRLRHCLSL